MVETDRWRLQISAMFAVDLALSSNGLDVFLLHNNNGHR